MKVFSNLAISLDGKIADARKPKSSLGTPLDRRTMDKIRGLCDVIVVGGNTLRAFPHTYKIGSASARDRPKSKSKASAKLRQPANAVVTASGDLDPKAPFWNDPEVVRFVFTTDKGFARASKAAAERAFVVSCGKDRVEISTLLKRLKSSGLERVLVEGGGELVSEFVRAKALNELYVTLTPWILGNRSNPTLVGGDVMPEWSSLKLISARKIRDEIYLHYKVKGAGLRV